MRNVVTFFSVGGLQMGSFKLYKHVSGLKSVTYVETTDTLVSLDQDGCVCLWDMSTKREHV